MRESDDVVPELRKRCILSALRRSACVERTMVVFNVWTELITLRMLRTEMQSKRINWFIVSDSTTMVVIKISELLGNPITAQQSAATISESHLRSIERDSLFIVLRRLHLEP